MTRDEALGIAREVFASEVTERSMNDMVDFLAMLGVLKLRTAQDDIDEKAAEGLQKWEGLKGTGLPASAVIGYLRVIGYKVVPDGDGLQKRRS